MKHILFALLILTAAKAGAQKQLTSPAYLVMDSSVTTATNFANLIGNGLELRKIDSAGGYTYTYYNSNNDKVDVFLRYSPRHGAYTSRTINDIEITAPNATAIDIFNKYFNLKLASLDDLGTLPNLNFTYKGDKYTAYVSRNTNNNGYNGFTTIILDHQR